MKQKLIELMQRGLTFSPDLGIVGIEDTAQKMVKYLDEEYFDNDLGEDYCSCHRFQGQLTQIDQECPIHGHKLVEL